MLVAAGRGARARHDVVSFDDTYRDLASLTELIRSADLVVLPYDSDDQVTSGVLVDAVAAGRPVVATAFPHAVELLGERRRHRRAPARPRRPGRRHPGRAHRPERVAERMAAEARRLAPELSWAAVAGRYDALADRRSAAPRAPAVRGVIAPDPPRPARAGAPLRPPGATS